MKTRSTYLAYLGLLATHTRVALGKKCYYVDGTEAGIDYPCNPDAENSFCCGMSPWGFACLENGLCQSEDGKIVRGSCTDKTWKSDACTKLCMNTAIGGQDLVSCSNVTGKDTSFCCAEGKEYCCDSGVGRFERGPSNPQTIALWDKESTAWVVQEISTRTTSTPTSSSTTQASTTTSDRVTDAVQTPGASNGDTIGTTNAPTSLQTTTGNPGDSERSTESTGLSTGAKAGIGVGAAVGALLIAAVVFLWWKLHKTTKQMAETMNNQYQATYPPSTPAVSYYAGAPIVKTELPAEREVHELSGHYVPYGNGSEMPYSATSPAESFTRR